jgi:hypothetical protein
VSKKTAFAALCGFILLAVVCATGALRNPGYSELSNGRGGVNVEAVTYSPDMHFDKKRSLELSRPPSIRCFGPTAPGVIAQKMKPAVGRRLRFTQTSM